MKFLGVFLVLWGGALVGCGGAKNASDTANTAKSADQRAKQMAGLDGRLVDREACDSSKKNREESLFDTNGDDVPDLRKVFAHVGENVSLRLILLCREVDLNSDGVKDIIRLYSEDGRPLREELDRDFDKVVDLVSFFEDGRVSREAHDQDRDGRVDTKIFYEDGVPLRTERDVAGRSKGDKWQPDRWEYYHEGHVVRVGMDVDGDGGVDRWDRDEERMKLDEEPAAADETAEGEPEPEDGAAKEGDEASKTDSKDKKSAKKDGKADGGKSDSKETAKK